jgi:hypothetical protein
MNNEERLLHSLFSETNLKEDLNEILEYLDKMFKVIKEFNKEKYSDKFDNEIIKLIVKEGFENFLSSKVKLYSFDREDSDDEDYGKSEKKEEV